MSDLDALLAAVLYEPDDDTPRLVLADWLEETGQDSHTARAEFIRLQVADRDKHRQAELLGEWATDWLPEGLQDGAADAMESRDGFSWAVGDVWDAGRCTVTFARGFISTVALPGLPEITLDETTGAVVADGFTASLLAAFEEHPVERVRLKVHQAEDWRIEKRLSVVHGSRLVEPEQWRCRGPHAWGPPLCWASDRDGLAEQLQGAMTDRIEELVRLMRLTRPADGVDE